MIKQRIVISIMLLSIFLTVMSLTTHSFESIHAQKNESIAVQEPFSQDQSFKSDFDTFVTSEPEGYGVYEERGSDTFRPGETIILYIEPSGFEYGYLTDELGNTLYTMDFTADFTITDINGNVLGGQQGLPIGDIISHHQNKELFIPFTITQTTPFPPGEYVVIYTITDENSGNSFDIVKEITIAETF